VKVGREGTHMYSRTIDIKMSGGHTKGTLSKGSRGESLS
jgi:hypothetical protein